MISLAKCTLQNYGTIFLVFALLFTNPVHASHYPVHQPVLNERPTLLQGQVKPLLGLIIPLYNRPDGSWQEVIQAKSAHPSVPMAVIVNPANGPGWYRQPVFAAAIQAFRSAGITVLGYVHTSYGSRNVNHVTDDVKLWKQWYNVNGIFYDEMAASASSKSYYQKIVDYAHSVGLRFTMGNPGERVSSSYMGMMNVLNIYEERNTPSVSSIQATTRGYARSNFAVLTLDRSTLDWSFIFNAARYVGWIYITNGNLPNPYNALPRYFSALVSIVGDADGHFTAMAHPHALP